MERNVNNNSDSTIYLILNIPFDEEPLEFSFKPDVNGEIKFDYSYDGYITYYIINEEQLENYDLEIQNEFETKGQFYNDTTFRLIFYNSNKNKPDTLFFFEMAENLLIHPVRYFTSGYYSGEWSEICDSFDYFVDIRSYIFEGDDASKINLLISKNITRYEY